MITAIVVDDDQYNVDLFSEFLEFMQVKILGKGSDGQQAVELYEQYKPDIVFLDLLMPEYDGLYALENIREINPSAHIVVVTAVVDKNSRDKLEKLAPNLVIQKPFEPEQIADVINKMKEAKGYVMRNEKGKIKPLHLCTAERFFEVFYVSSESAFLADMPSSRL